MSEQRTGGEMGQEMRVLTVEDQQRLAEVKAQLAQKEQERDKLTEKWEGPEIVSGPVEGGDGTILFKPAPEQPAEKKEELYALSKEISVLRDQIENIEQGPLE